jgi:hypothetical protein
MRLYLKPLSGLAALALVALTGCASSRYAETAPPMPDFLHSLSLHDQKVAVTGYRLGQADLTNALYQNIRNSGGSK